MEEHLDTLDEEPPALDELEEETPAVELVVNDEQEAEIPPEYECDLCDWKPKKNCKDFKRALREHYKKAHPEYYEANFKTRKSKKTKINILQAVSDKVEEVKEHTTNVGVSEEEQREQLIEDLNVLKVKFKDIDYDWVYNNNSSLELLKREKSMFMRILQDKVGTKAIFNLLIVGSKGAERVCDSLGLADLEGYSGDVKSSEDEILPILQEMVDTGLISSKALTPEIRLGMVMASLGVNRMEKNRVLRIGADAGS